MGNTRGMATTPRNYRSHDYVSPHTPALRDTLASRVVGTALRYSLEQDDSANPDAKFHAANAARVAYLVADAMLAERAKATGVK